MTRASSDSDATVRPFMSALTEAMSFTQAELNRYKRHLLLKEVGGEGQQRLKQARVLVGGTTWRPNSNPTTTA